MTELHANDAIVDYAGILKTVGDLQDRFSLMNLLDYCVIVEGLVLHNRLVMVGSTPHAASAESRVGRTISEKLKPWLDEGVLVFDTEPAPLQDIQRMTNDLVTIGNSTRDAQSQYRRLENAFFETGRLVAAEKARRRPALPLLRQAPYYERSANVPQDHAVCNLIGKYRTLKDALESMRDNTRLQLQPYIAVPVPPLALSALQKCKHPQDILTAALELRQQFRKLRDALGDLRELLLDPAVPPSKKTDHIASWQRTWQTLDDWTRGAALLQLANSSNEMLDANKMFDGLDVEDVKWSVLVKKLLEKAERGWHSWRIRMLHRTARNYINTSDHAMNSLVETVFQHRIVQADVQQVKAFCDALKNPEELAVSACPGSTTQRTPSTTAG
jgi:hypothetical protein